MNRINALISVLGVLPGTMLLVFAVREYRAGASALWIGLATLILLSAVHALVRDIRKLRGTGAVPDRE